MKRQIRIPGIAGSLRRESYNRATLRGLDFNQTSIRYGARHVARAYYLCSISDDDWTTYNRNYAGERFSPLKEIITANAHRRSGRG